MEIQILEDPVLLGKAAADHAEGLIRETISARGHANIILATGASQFEVLSNLVSADLPWEKVTMFHLDEYLGIPEKHPASFRRYLTERFLEKVGFRCTYYLIHGDHPNPEEECRRVSELIQKYPIDVALIGIGENGHLAFNDPPADFDTEEPYLVVHLDQACRQQQFGEGWFETISDVPTTAISMSIKQILKSKHLIVSVPDLRKADAVRNAVRGELTNECPASILRTHDHCYLFLDKASASKL